MKRRRGGQEGRRKKDGGCEQKKEGSEEGGRGRNREQERTLIVNGLLTDLNWAIGKEETEEPFASRRRSLSVSERGGDLGGRAKGKERRKGNRRKKGGGRTTVKVVGQADILLSEGCMVSILSALRNPRGVPSISPICQMVVGICVEMRV